jgi:23S rRNA (cytosine1962-C5)-methyltransferase
MTAALPSVFLRAGREASVLRRHPWVFSGAIDRVEGHPQPGDTVRVRSAAGAELGQGMWSPASQIRVRLWTFDPRETVDEDFLRRRLAGALRRREELGGLAAPRAAARLVYAEADGLPGLIVDRYADVLVCQFLTAGAARWREETVEALRSLTEVRAVVERSDADAISREGLLPRAGMLHGDEPGPVEIEEPAGVFRVDTRHGHKTGFYLDQRANREWVLRLAKGRETLNAFAYTGGFGVAARRGGATRVVNLDSSGPALELARENFRLNQVLDDAVTFEDADAFQQLRRYRDARQAFDLIVLDPPKFADNPAQVDRACRGYKDINLLACKLLRPGGLLVTFSCSGGVSADLFQKVVAGAALDSGREARILHRLAQAPDHPVLTTHPESDYLKGLVLRVE